MARLSLAPDLPLILCFRLIAAGDSPPVFRPVPPLDFTFGGRATDRRSSPPLPPPLPSPSSSGKLRKRLVVRGSRVRLCATDMRMRGCAPSIVYSIKCIRHWRNEATKKSSLYTIVCLVVSGATSEHVYRYDRVLLIVARNMFVQHFYRLSFNDNGERY